MRFVEMGNKNIGKDECCEIGKRLTKAFRNVIIFMRKLQRESCIEYNWS